jgi:hypothetical protein
LSPTGGLTVSGGCGQPKMQLGGVVAEAAAASAQLPVPLTASTTRAASARQAAQSGRPSSVTEAAASGSARRRA